ncbi:MAG: hypothetical protein AB1489_41160 [Acidobacteriota bacterium]
MKRIISFAVIAIFTALSFESKVHQRTSYLQQGDAMATQINQSQVAASKQLEKLFNEDQSDNRPYNTPEQRKESDERARQRINQVSEIVSKGLLQSADDYYHAAMVFQHGNKPNDYLTAHVLATVAGFKGHTWGNWLSAASLDAFLLSMGRSQIMGTIYGKDNFQRYDKFLNDTIRKQYCVPPLEVQMKNEEFIEKRVGNFQRRAKECEN